MDVRKETPQWRKSSRSATSACVEIASRLDAILVRDSKNPHGAILSFDRTTFAAFIGGVVRGEFDPH